MDFLGTHIILCKIGANLVVLQKLNSFIIKWLLHKMPGKTKPSNFRLNFASLNKFPDLLKLPTRLKRRTPSRVSRHFFPCRFARQLPNWLFATCLYSVDWFAFSRPRRPESSLFCFGRGLFALRAPSFVGKELAVWFGGHTRSAYVIWDGATVSFVWRTRIYGKRSGC